MSTPAVTWIIPVLNGMPYLPQALDSIRAQTFADHEVLVWDNGSTDGTLDVLREWLPGRIPGRFITGKPLSLGLSLRALVEEVRTPFVARMDADDICFPERLARQMQFLEHRPDVHLVGTNRVEITWEGEVIQSNGEPDERGFATSEFDLNFTDLLHATLRAPRLLHPSVTFRTDAVVACGNYRDLSTSDLPYWCEDYDLWLRLLTRHRAETIGEPLVYRRNNPGGVTVTEKKRGLAACARRAAWLDAGGAFAGIADARISQRLWDRQLRFALPVITGIARTFTQRDGIPWMKRLAMPSFQASAQKMLNRGDYLTRLFLRAFRLSTPSTPA